MIGRTTNESDLFVDEYPTIALPFVAYKSKTKVPKGKDSFRHRLSDTITLTSFVKPIDEVVQTYQGQVFAYEFAYHIPPKRAYHALEVQLFVLEKDDIGARKFRKILSDFAYKNNPGWDEYKKNKEYFVIK